MCQLAEYTAKGVEIRREDLREQNKIWQHPWMLVHRVRLHDRLKLIATGEKGEGSPAKLHLSARVAKIEPGESKVVLENGQEIQADVILGADGIYVGFVIYSARYIAKKEFLVQDANLPDRTAKQVVQLWQSSVSLSHSSQSRT